MSSRTITYTHTDEAPALATYAFYPIIKRLAATADITMDIKDISLASRILAQFSSYLQMEQKTVDDLAVLGNLVKTPEAVLIKLPNISASLSQLLVAIQELQDKGFGLPSYPESPQNDEEWKIKETYDKIKGSAVNPVLREGNSDRRPPQAVKKFAQKNPHSMGAWDKASTSHVATMSQGDFFHSERSVCLNEATTVSIRLVHNEGITDLKQGLDLIKGEIVDCAVMSKKALCNFIAEQLADARANNTLFSVHLKATMMKVADPIIFGHVLRSFFAPVFKQFALEFTDAGVDANNGLADLYAKIKVLPQSTQQEIEQAIQDCYQQGPALAMVDSDKGITNLHVSSDVIIDASMPAALRSSGCMYNAKGQLQFTKFVIPDSSYAGVYDAVVNHCKLHGAFDPTTMGSVSNVGLMAQKAEEYGSHDKTFEVEYDGIIEVVAESGEVILSQDVERGDIFRMCQTKEAPIANWVKLAVERAKDSGQPTIFWLDIKRAHDAQLIERVNYHLAQYDTTGLIIEILDPVAATKRTLEIIDKGESCISVTGNVLRDYLTDLFPILELGTSAKMLSIVPMMNDGVMFETGAGGSAPKHVQQFLAENHLRWDSLGEFLALAGAFEHVGKKDKNNKALILSECLNKAIERLLDENKSPSRKVRELDNRGSQFYLVKFWLEELAKQSQDKLIAQKFNRIANILKENEETILQEFVDSQGTPADIGGYYAPDLSKVMGAMQSSLIFNSVVKQL